ncbi:MAG: hypothetical protein JWO36_2407 [Myxococcales bacterium]|nr:hypothetical protein [Myxococcales bacterium]
MSVAIETRPLVPFGLEVRVPEGTEWGAIDANLLHAFIAEHRVVVVKGVRLLDKPALPAAARRLGPLQPWSFGAVNELVPTPGTKNYLYTHHAVPLHWDGAFTQKPPRYLFFQCVSAEPAPGGETIFVDTTRVWAAADERMRDRWRALSFAYETARVVHYGGRFTAKVVAQHPYSGETVMRFAEPVDDLNPVSVTALGTSPLESAAVISELRGALATEDVVLAHRWAAGDIVIADNHALLHGRRTFQRGTARHLQRVNVHGPERAMRDTLSDVVRIRRPEFMIAEIPILLIPALLVAGSLGALATGRFLEVVALFFLLFHFGDMVNCLADRDLDAVYKTHLSEAIYGLGVRNVRYQIAFTALASLGLSAWIGIQTGRIELVGFVAIGLAIAWAYSAAPLRFKGRGLLAVLTLWSVIFVGPMLIVARALGGTLSPALVAIVVAYGTMQEGIVLVNTAEDLPEDIAAGVRTAAVSLGLAQSITLALVLVAAGGLTVIAMLAHAGATLAVFPLAGAVLWVLWELAAILRSVHGRTLANAIAALRPRARRMPLWITATAWTTLLATVYSRS